MNKIIIILFVVITGITLPACKAAKNTTIGLGDDYSLKSDGDVKWISSENVMNPGIYPNVIDYAANSDFIIATQKPSADDYKIFLGQDIREKYMLIYRIDTALDNPLINDFLASHLWKDKNVHARVAKAISGNIEDSRQEMAAIADSLIRNEAEYKKVFVNELNYWIIFKQDHFVLGPLNKADYLSHRTELHIPKSLALKSND